jgi:ankyrin repeat protein
LGLAQSHRTALAWASGHGNAHAVRELLQARHGQTAEGGKTGGKSRSEYAKIIKIWVLYIYDIWNFPFFLAMKDGI